MSDQQAGWRAAGGYELNQLQCPALSSPTQRENTNQKAASRLLFLQVTNQVIPNFLVSVTKDRISAVCLFETESHIAWAGLSYVAEPGLDLSLFTSRVLRLCS